MSRYAVISDIHGNLYAFQAVLAAMPALNIESLICLGDTVGYGPHPGECLDLVVRHCDIVVQGNHDQAVVDPLCADTFNGAAREAIYWTRAALGPLHLNALLQMPLTRRLGPGDSIHCVHDSPGAGPTNYVHDKQIAALAFRGLADLDAEICLIGHTHVPMVFEAPPLADAEATLSATDLTAYIPSHEVEIDLRPELRYICNPGSVGQPRDCDARASFAVLDLDQRTFTVHRVAYDVAAAQLATQQAGLPTVLADRLAIGA
ncbi:MAG: metallophosphoesterase family protein [Planctomycetes bacterium]|nr:metallophosphoesterase family protein [Planctomycetota bacterium]